MAITEEMIGTASAAVYERSLKVLPIDIVQTLQEARRREKSDLGRVTLEIIIKNIELAKERDFLICQDTGVPRYFVRLGLQAEIEGDLEKAIRAGAARATQSVPLIAHSVHPLTRFNPGTNVGPGAPVIHLELAPDDGGLEITAAPVSAIEDRSAVRVFDVVESWEEIKRFVARTVARAGTVCPPLIIGVGYGGSLDTVAKLATLATLRPLTRRNPDPALASLELELLDEINQLGIGPMNLGGDTTALVVNIETAYTHSVCTPVAVRTECWCARRACARIDANGNVTLY